MGSRRTNLRLGLGLALGSAILAGCGGATNAGAAASTAPIATAATAGTSKPPEVAPASGIILELTAQQPKGKDVGWDIYELSGPANQTFEIAYTNDDAVRHDFAVLPEAGYVGDVLFKSEMVPALEFATLTVPGLPAGTYDYVCSLHSTNMRGTLTLE
jgi:hypothetical protein